MKRSNLVSGRPLSAHRPETDVNQTNTVLDPHSSAPAPHCSQSYYGCCPDGHTSAGGPHSVGCPLAPAPTPAQPSCVQTRWEPVIKLWLGELWSRNSYGIDPFLTHTVLPSYHTKLSVDKHQACQHYGYVKHKCWAMLRKVWVKCKLTKCRVHWTEQGVIHHCIDDNYHRTTDINFRFLTNVKWK